MAGACGAARTGQLPLAAVRYFNPYQSPTNWAAGGSAIYQGGGASVRKYSGSIPVDNLSGTYALVLDAVNPAGGRWNVFFKVSGNPLNWLRTGTLPPTLQVAPVSSGFTLSWPLPSAPFRLFSTSSLTLPVTWIHVTNQPVRFANRVRQAFLPGGTGRTFFWRLQL